jgi:hypothetical protein
MGTIQSRSDQSRHQILLDSASAGARRILPAAKRPDLQKHGGPFFGCGDPVVDQLTSARAETTIERLMGEPRRGWPPVRRIRIGQPRLTPWSSLTASFTSSTTIYDVGAAVAERVAAAPNEATMATSSAQSNAASTGKCTR